MQANESFRLVVRRGPQPNQIYELKQDSISLGRDIKNDIVINDPEVSRHHLQITRTADGYTIEDMGSTNGTFIGGHRINTPRALTHGEMIGLGETVTLQYERVRLASGFGDAAAAPYAPPAAPQPQQPSPYAPPQQAQPQQPNPYAPQQGQPPSANPAPYVPPQAASQAPYAPAQPQQPASAQQPYDQQQQSGYGAGYYGPQAPVAAGYDHDPAAVREEESRNTLRWVGIGCGTLSVVCCCSSAIGLVIIDSANLWNSIPILPDLLRPIAQLIWGG